MILFVVMFLDLRRAKGRLKVGGLAAWQQVMTQAPVEPHEQPQILKALPPANGLFPAAIAQAIEPFGQPLAGLGGHLKERGASVDP